MSWKEELFYLGGFLGVKGNEASKVQAWVTFPGPLGANKAQGGWQGLEGGLVGRRQV